MEDTVPGKSYTKIKVRLRMMEEVLVLVLEDKRYLEADVAVLEAERESIEPSSASLRGMHSELEMLEAELTAIKCQSFPGEMELIMKGPNASHVPTKDDLRRLCEANGIGTLADGEFVCGECGGVRTEIACKYCKLALDAAGTDLVEDLKSRVISLPR